VSISVVKFLVLISFSFHISPFQLSLTEMIVAEVGQRRGAFIASDDDDVTFKQNIDGRSSERAPAHSFRVHSLGGRPGRLIPGNAVCEACLTSCSIWLLGAINVAN